MAVAAYSSEGAADPTTEVAGLAEVRAVGAVLAGEEEAASGLIARRHRRPRIAIPGVARAFSPRPRSSRVSRLAAQF